MVRCANNYTHRGKARLCRLKPPVDTKDKLLGDASWAIALPFALNGARGAAPGRVTATHSTRV